MIDLEKLSDQELEAIASNNLEALSDKTLEMIASSGQKSLIDKSRLGEVKPRLRDDVGAIAAQFGSGLLMDVPNIGAKPISEVVGGTPLNYMDRMSRLAQNPKDAFQRFLVAGPGAGISSPVEQPTLNSEFGVPVVPQPRSRLGQVLGLGANLAGQAITGKVVSGAMTPKVRMGPSIPSADEVSSAINKTKSVAGEKAIYTSDKAISRFRESSNALSAKFGKALKDEGFLDSTISREKATSFFNKIKDKSGISSKSPEVMSPKEKAFLSYVDEATKNPEISGNDIYEKFKSISGQRGTRLWSAFNDALGEEFSNLKKVRSSFAPEIQSKKVAEKILNPYGTQGGSDLRRSYSFFKKAATGKLNDAEIKISESMERFLGKGFFDELKQNAENLNSQKSFLEFVKNRTAQELGKKGGFWNRAKSELIKKAGTFALGAGGYDVIRRLSSKD